MNNILSLLGLCKKSGRMICGTDMVIDSMQKKKIFFIFIASDSTEATIDKIEKKAYFYQVPINKSFDTLSLNQALGTNNFKVIGISDLGFSKKFIELSKVERE